MTLRLERLGRHAQARAGNPPKGPWPASAVEAAEPIVEKYAQDWPAWGHRKIHALMRADGYDVSVSTVERALRRRNLLPVDYHRQRRELAFADPPDGPNQVWQLDFSAFETTAGGVRRIAGCADFSLTRRRMKARMELTIGGHPGRLGRQVRA